MKLNKKIASILQFEKIIHAHILMKVLEAFDIIRKQTSEYNVFITQK